MEMYQVGSRGGFDDCLFDESGQIPLAGPHALTSSGCEILLIETAGWSVVARAGLTDPVRREFPVIPSDENARHAPRYGWRRGRTGSRSTGWRGFEARSPASPEPSAQEHHAARLLPEREAHPRAGRRHYAVRRYEFPGMKPLGPPLESGDGDNPFAESMAYLGRANRAMVGTGEGRIFVIDTISTEIDEVVLEGHGAPPDRRLLSESLAREGSGDGRPRTSSVWTGRSSSCIAVKAARSRPNGRIPSCGSRSAGRLLRSGP